MHGHRQVTRRRSSGCVARRGDLAAPDEISEARRRSRRPPELHETGMDSYRDVGPTCPRPAAVPAVVRLLASLALAAPAAPAAQMPACDPCVVGVVIDSPWERNADTLAAFESAVIELTAPRFDVVVPPSKRRAGDSTPTGVRAAVEASLADPGVDLVLAVGPLATASADRRGSLPKPVVGVFALGPDLQALPIGVSPDGERVSGKRNLSYVTFPNDLVDDVRRFRELVPFARITFLVSGPLLDAGAGLEARLRAALAPIGREAISIEVVRVGASAAEALDAVRPAAEAVYVLPQPQLPPGEFDRLIGGLNARRLPTFSSLGRSAVDAGLLMSLYDDADLRRLGRRAALHVQRLLLGEDAGALPIDFRRERRLTLNMATARTLGVYPDWRVLTEAELLHDTPPAAGRRLSLVMAAREAVAANLDLAADERHVAAGRQTVRESRAGLRPRLFASAAAQRIDPDRAAASFGVLPAWLAGGSLGVSQIVYSDAARAHVEVHEHRQAAREQSRAERRLDIVHAAAVGYLDVLRAIAFERIQRENLIVTRSNLDLAAARRRIGVARASEVIRWENEIATNRRRVIDAGARRRVAEIALNRLLHRPLEAPFELADVDVDEPGLLSAGAFERYARNPFAFAIFRDFLTRQGLARAPELRRIDAAIAAQARTVLAARRALRTPTVTARGDLTALARPRAGDIDLGGLRLTTPRASRLDWTVGVSASLPLFEGGARRAARARADRELEALRLRRRAEAERIEQRIRTALHFAGASYAGIELTADAASAARRHLALVTGSYEEGVVSILDLLDAQHAVVVAELAEANAVHDHLIDLMDAQRAFGRFELFADDAELAAVAGELRAFFLEAGYDPRAGS